MRLFYTTEDFVYKGLAYPSVPFLCRDDMEFVTDANDYLLWLALENARTSSPGTWKTHAESLYDFFSWLETNHLQWDTKAQKGPGGEEITNIALYRNWSLDLTDPETGLPRIQRSTVRRRLTNLMSFYQWARNRGRIDFLPWTSDFRVATESHPSMYRHTHTARVVARDNLRPKAIKKLLPVLTISQCRELLHACSPATLLIMTKLMLQTGLRNEECRTFPRKYVFDPIGAPEKKRIPVNLDPRDMSLKGNKPRRIYVTWHLMKSLFDYLNFGQGAARAKMYREAHREGTSLVFLNRTGDPWNEKGLNNAYRRLWVSSPGKKPVLGFKVAPHMLRHTFATFELYAESRRTSLAEALAWVRDRLGHRSIATTTVYVHYLDLIEAPELNQYQEEIDTMFGDR